MTNTIIDSGNIAEINNFEEIEDFADLTATKLEDSTTMDFHVQMRGYTMRDFETMVVHAAAQQLMQGRTFASEIREKAVEIANAKVNEQLSTVLRDIMGLTVQTRGKETVTLGQMIGMEAKDYLTQPVNSRGEIDTSMYSTDKKSRAAYLVQEYVRSHFAKEIKTAMDAMISELKAQVITTISETVNAERQRVAAALGYEIAARR